MVSLRRHVNLFVFHLSISFHKNTLGEFESREGERPSGLVFALSSLATASPRVPEGMRLQREGGKTAETASMFRRSLRTTLSGLPRGATVEHTKEPDESQGASLRALNPVHVCPIICNLCMSVESGSYIASNLRTAQLMLAESPGVYSL